jgi:nitroreductase
MDTFESIYKRRSIRKFTNQPIENEVMEKLLDAARWAPNGGNINAWRFVVVTSEFQKKLLLKFAPGISNMPAAMIVICIKPKQKKQLKEATRLMYMADAAIASENIALAAYALGIGSCIVISFASVAIGPILNLPDNISPYLMITLGYPDEIPEPPPRLPINEIAFQDEYGKEWTS